MTGAGHPRSAGGSGRAAWIAVIALGLLVATSAGAQTSGASPWQVVFRIPRPVRGRWLLAMWASSPNDVFAAGRGCIVRFDGSRWAITPDHSDAGILDIEGSGPRDVYAVGFYETIQRWNGTSWTLEHRDGSHGPHSTPLHPVVVIGPGNAYTRNYARRTQALHRRSDGTWEVVSLEEAQRATGGRMAYQPAAPPAAPCAGDVRWTRGGSWVAACGRSLWILRSTGWLDTGLRVPSMFEFVRHLEIDATRDIVVLRNGDVMFRNGSVWSRELSAGDRGHELLRVGNVVYLTAGDRIYRRTLAGADSATR